ncbi:MAG: replication initiation protein [Spirochaetota bacterium]|nr:replication initiation protein [Spirochaetota bacterium]
MKEKNLITKSNQLNEARYSLNAMQQKIVLCVISLIQPDDEDFKTYELKIKDLVEILGITGTSIYSDLRIIFKKLLQQVLEIPDNSSGDKNKSLVQVNWFSFIKTIPKEGKIEARFDPFLKPYLLQLKQQFISYHLKNVVQLKSGYSIRIYELLKQYEKMGFRVFELSELKKILGLEQDKYKKYGHFKSRIILPSQIELPKKTDIDFLFEEIKTGRVVTAIKFVIKKKSLPANNTLIKEKIEINSEMKLLINLLPEEYQTKETILGTISKYLKKEGFSYVERNIKYTNSYKPKNYRVYLLKSLSNNWGKQLQEDLDVKKQIEEAKKENKVLELEEIKLEKEITEKIETFISQNESQLKEEALERLEDDFKQNDAKSRLALLGMIDLIAREKLGIKPLV